MRYKETDTNQLYDIEQDTPLYNLEEEPGVELDKEAGGKVAARRPSPVAILFKTMFGPVEGWKALKRARYSTDEFARRCFYPLIALAAFSEVSMFLYEANVTFADWAKEGLATFVTFFFGYFTVFPTAELLLPRGSRECLRKDFGHQFVMLAMSTFAIFWTLIQLLPMLDPVLVFLPLWTGYIIWKGTKALRVEQDLENKTRGVLCSLIIGLPLLWNWVMTEILLPLTL